MTRVETRAIRNDTARPAQLSGDYVIDGRVGTIRVSGGTSNLVSALHSARRLDGLLFYSTGELGTVFRDGRPVATVYGGRS